MLVDAEHAFDPAYSKALGVDVENLIVCQPDNGEMALESNTSYFPWGFVSDRFSIYVMIYAILTSTKVMLKGFVTHKKTHQT